MMEAAGSYETSVHVSQDRKQQLSQSPLRENLNLHYYLDVVNEGRFIKFQQN